MRHVVRSAVIVVILVGSGVCVATQADVLLANGDFETGVAGQPWPTGWSPTVLPDLAPYVEFRWTTDQVHGGDHSVAVSIRDDHPDQKVSYNWTSTMQGWAPGGTYELEGWIKTRQVTTSAFICIQCWDASRTQILAIATTESAYPVTGRSVWTAVKATFLVPAGTAEVRIRAGISAPENKGGTTWFDDIKVKPVTPPADSKP